jgi:sugar O-acyltransferase (sialic acid O-acetyltransferase NeuD family)
VNFWERDPDIMKILIVGAGGHGQVVADILLRMKEFDALVDPIGYLGDNVDLHRRELLGIPVLESVNQISSVPHDGIVVALGDNKVRERIFRELRTNGENLVIARHPRVVIAPDVHIGPGTMICAGVVVNPAADIGSDVILNTGCTIEHHNRIGDHVHIAPGAHLGGEVSIGAGSLVGIGATVMPGRHVGARCIVGAGALVQKDIPDGSTAIGIPARIVKKLATGNT